MIATRLRLTSRGDDVFLQTSQLRVTDFDTQITARDHHGIACLNDAIEIDERLAAFDLCDEVTVPAFLAQQVTRFIHVAAIACERNGQ